MPAIQMQQTLPMTKKRTFRIFWAILWRATILSMLAGLVVGFLYAFIGVKTGLLHDASQAEQGGAFLGYGISLLVSFFVMRHVLHKNFGEFRIALVATEGGYEYAGTD